jgi:hypothetical protein
VEAYGTEPSKKSSSKQVKAVDFDEARRLVRSAEKRDDKLRNFVAVMRHLYRTGRLVHNLGPRDLDRAFWDRDDIREDLDALNLACSYINVIVATTAARTPMITAEPAFITDDTQRAADAVAALVKGFLEDDTSIEVARRAGLDASISGDGFGHVVWVAEEEELSEEEWLKAVELAYAEYAAMALEEGDDPMPPEPLEPDIPRTRVKVNRPSLRYVSPIDVLLPAHVSDVSETPWYAIRSVQRVADVKANPMFDKEAVAMLKSERVDVEDNARRLETEQHNESDLDALTTVVTFYDVKSHRIVVFTKDCAKPLYEGPNPNQFDDVCLVHLRGYRDGEHLRGFGDLELVAGLLDKLNYVVRQQLDNLDRQGTVFVARDDVLTDEDRANLEMARPGDVVLMRGIQDGVRLQDAIEAFPTTALSADVYQARQQIVEDMGKVLGLSDFQLGGLGPSRMSGTAAAVADGVATLRAQQRLEAYESFYVRVATLFYKLSRQHLDEDQVVKIVGPDGSLFQETLEAEELSMDFFLKVKTGSMAAVNPATRSQRGMELMNMAERLEASGYDADTLRRYALREMGVDPDLMGVRRQPIQEPAGPAALAPEMGVGGDVSSVDPMQQPLGEQMFEEQMFEEQMPIDPDSTQAAIMQMGGPPLPTGEQGFAF